MLNMPFSRRTADTHSGFTLIELLVVISVIGILAAVLLANFVNVRGRAADASKKNSLRQLKTALRLYYNDYQRYPAASGTNFSGCGVNGTTACSAGGVFSAGNPTTVYINEIPVGVKYYTNGSNSFLISIPLENVTDAEIVASQTKCDVDDRSFYPGSPPNTEYFMCED